MNEFNAYFASVFKPNTNIGSDKTTNLNDNKPNTSPLVDHSPFVVYKAMRAAKKSHFLLALTTYLLYFRLN